MLYNVLGSAVYSLWSRQTFIGVYSLIIIIHYTDDEDSTHPWNVGLLQHVVWNAAPWEPECRQGYTCSVCPAPVTPSIMFWLKEAGLTEDRPSVPCACRTALTGAWRHPAPLDSVSVVRHASHQCRQQSSLFNSGSTSVSNVQQRHSPTHGKYRQQYSFWVQGCNGIQYQFCSFQINTAVRLSESPVTVTPVPNLSQAFGKKLNVSGSLVRFQVITAASMNMAVFCDVARWTTAKTDRRSKYVYWHPWPWWWRQ